MINLVKRNLEQQVLKNQDDIEVLKQLGMPGVKISGIVDHISDLPSPASDGDLYALRATLNEYDLYLYYDGAWENLGQFPKPGPQGIQGSQGPTGATGQSTRWYTGVSFPSTNVKDGDMFLNTSSYQVYIRSGGQWVSQTNIKGAAGRDGLNGNSITSIDTQHQGTNTVVTINTDKLSPVVFNVPDGTPGAGFHIAHIYPDDVEGAPTLSTLPADIEDTIEEEWPAATSDPSEAVLVKTTQDGDFIFVIIVDNSVNKWDNVGQIQSVEGPAGDPGDRIMDSQDIMKEAAGAQYPNTYKLYIRSIPYVPVAPGADYSPSEGYPAFQIVMLPKSVESTTVRKSGFLYFFYEDPPTP